MGAEDLITCKTCGAGKPPAEFYFKNNGKIRFKTCRACHSKRCLAVHVANRASRLEQMRSRYRNNREGRIKASKAWAFKNPDRRRQITARYRDGNRDRLRAYGSKYVKKNWVRFKESKLYRRMKGAPIVPAWANRFFISEIYELARLRTQITGVRYSVDHIVPLSSHLVCGLHVETNLRVVPQSLNAAKGNRRWPDMPGV